MVHFKLINSLLDDPELFPVLLIAPDENEQNYACDINEEFDNNLIVIEADFMAASSVLSNLDYLVTPDTVIKHMADLVDLPTVEISLGKSPYYKQGSVKEGNLILTPTITKRSWYSKDPSNDTFCPIKSEDVFTALKCLIDYKKVRYAKFSKDVSLYRVENDSLGIWYRNIAGALDFEHEVSRSVSREYIISYFNTEENKPMFSDISEFNQKDLDKWILAQKDAITEITRDLLAGIRSLRQGQNNKQKSMVFARAIEKTFFSL